MFSLIGVSTVCAVVVLVSGCVHTLSRPWAQAGRALPLPARYDASAYPTPELSRSLLGLFESSQLRAVTRRALENNPDLAAAGARLDEAGFNLKGRTPS